MAELNNELDLTAPAAPTLTLDPIADEAAEAAKLEAPKAEPVKVEDTPLSPEEQKMVNDFAEKLSLIHISEPTRRTPISYAVFCLKKKK